MVATRRVLNRYVLKTLGLGLLLVCLSRVSAFGVNPDPSERSVPENPAVMALSGWAFSNRANQSFETIVQQQLPAFGWVYPGDTDLNPIPDANHSIALELRESGSGKRLSGAWASLHDQETGRAHSVCLMPCSANINAGKDYMIAVRTAGRLPHIASIQTSTLSDGPFTVYMGSDLRDYFMKIGQCWADHVASGRPDTDALPCARMPAIIPEGAEQSGHCRVQFDVLETGWVANGRSLGCTDPVFAAAALDVLNFWYYVPATQRGQTMPTTGLVTKINFNILDSQGRRIDENGRVAQ